MCERVMSRKFETSIWEIWLKIQQWFLLKIVFSETPVTQHAHNPRKISSVSKKTFQVFNSLPTLWFPSDEPMHKQSSHAPPAPCRSTCPRAMTHLYTQYRKRKISVFLSPCELLLYNDFHIFRLTNLWRFPRDQTTCTFFFDLFDDRWRPLKQLSQMSVINLLSLLLVAFERKNKLPAPTVASQLSEMLENAENLNSPKRRNRMS